MLKQKQKKESVIFEEGVDWKIKKIKEHSFVLNYMNCDFEFPVPSLAGNHQIENAATAVSAVKSIKKIVINEKIITKGIENVFWPGRMQKINNGKLKKQCSGNFDIWLDGGHNNHAADVILKFIENWSDINKILILGMTMVKINWFLRKIIDKFNFLILLPINDHQYIHPYEIRKCKKKLKKDKNRMLFKQMMP